MTDEKDYKQLYIEAMMMHVDAVAQNRELQAENKKAKEEMAFWFSATIDNTQLLQKDQKIKELEEQNRALQQALRERQTDVFNAQQALKMIKPVTEYEQYKQLSAKLLEAQEQNTKLQVKNVALAKFQELYEEVNKQKDFYRKDSDEVREAYIKQQNNMVGYAVEVDMLKKERNELSEHLKKAFLDVNDLNDKLDSMTNLRNMYREDASRIHEAYQEANKELQRVRQLNCQLAHDLRRAESDYRKNPFEMPANEKEELQKQLQHMTDNFDRMTKSRDYYREEYNATAEILNTVTQLLNQAQEAIG